MKVITFKKIIILLVPFTIVGCTNGAREVTASIPLVSSQMASPDVIISEKYWPTLDDPSSKMLMHERYQINLGPFYKSSLGNTCRKLGIKIDALKTEPRIACRHSVSDQSATTINESYQPWYLVNDIVLGSSVIKL